MYQKKLDEDIRCPLEYGMSIFSGKWQTRILCLVANKGAMRFGELKTELVNITDGVLAATLNELIESELVSKSSSAQTISASYTLTEKGESLLPVLHELCAWSAHYYRDNGSIVMRQCRQCDLYKIWSVEADE